VSEFVTERSHGFDVCLTLAGSATPGLEEKQPPLLRAAVAKLLGRKILGPYRTRDPPTRFLIKTQYQLKRAAWIAIGRVSP
jgi:hypothetical protein